MLPALQVSCSGGVFPRRGAAAGVPTPWEVSSPAPSPAGSQRRRFPSEGWRPLPPPSSALPPSPDVMPLCLPYGGTFCGLLRRRRFCLRRFRVLPSVGGCVPVNPVVRLEVRLRLLVPSCISDGGYCGSPWSPPPYSSSRLVSPFTPPSSSPPVSGFEGAVHPAVKPSAMISASSRRFVRRCFSLNIWG
ncbi:hypothetical protein Taro_050346 [Colocasia esculenta]|uniref:Uncharacterized protein n=1 Tax=Colocasia esculenta TaxID=4460 RepID=A0A843XDN0_COLES|nr:hypothetical protein [Colocasia esculenta]